MSIGLQIVWAIGLTLCTALGKDLVYLSSKNFDNSRFRAMMFFCTGCLFLSIVVFTVTMDSIDSMTSKNYEMNYLSHEEAAWNDEIGPRISLRAATILNYVLTALQMVLCLRISALFLTVGM